MHYQCSQQVYEQDKTNEMLRSENIVVVFIPGHGAIDSKHGPENVCTGIPIDWQYPEVD